MLIKVENLRDKPEVELIKIFVDLMFQDQRYSYRLFSASDNGISDNHASHARLQHALQRHLPRLHSGGFSFRPSSQYND